MTVLRRRVQGLTGFLDFESALEMRAAVYAAEAHAEVGQVRRRTQDVPYIVHPREVADIVRTVSHTQAMLAAAWLHDVVEDTPRTRDDIRTEFDLVVGGYVGWMTDVSRLEDGNRAQRVAMDRAHSAQAPAEVQTIKLGDIFANLRDAKYLRRGFLRRYLPEKRALIEALEHGDTRLRAHTRALCEQVGRELNIAL